ncbi:probable 2-oxoglutarate dehydrogenase E1 component DHKTD1, mitochondrial [Gigantopelta aegis]|uniref:probable 2-oxoglutarate dehydrogenase E1 component DHKTD1, mitochondrial n=1 Tax=Gigantopelta aegis TaxID=1735272 RepID=UPI001B88D7FF|nr:probable 2-oxoglutarate dehydrogenase E1 component DHKTD1, mitochondrial [Gigantopelta aegis]
MLCFAEVPHFRIGGSIHLIVNNQLGFTTESHYGRSSRYCSDVAKMNSYPVIHVNADYPEEVVKASTLAVKYQRKFRKDVFIDLVCFRKWGHNELDEPSFTQPLMYRAIKSRRSIPDIYADNIVSDGLCSKSDLDQVVQDWSTTLSNDLQKVDTYVPQARHLHKQWSGLVQASDHITRWDTGVPVDVLKFVGAKSVEKPEDWKVHPTIEKTHIERRQHRLTQGTDIDWSTAEALAIGSLLYQGNVLVLSIKGQSNAFISF